jgi:hypothetical protein
MPSEQQLLNMIFADGAAPNERETAIALLKKITGKDRSGLVEKYARNDARGSDGDDSWRVRWTAEVKLRMAAERNLAKEKVDLEATKQALDAARQELKHAVRQEFKKVSRKISQRKKFSGALDTNIPGVEETVAPRNFRIDRKTYAIRSIEEVCRAYGLALVPNLDLPDIPVGRPYWLPRCGKVFTSICPTCGELLWVNSHYQRWTCLRCDCRFPNRKNNAPDAIRLVEHLTGCSYYNALWWVIGIGLPPQWKESQPAKPKTRRVRKPRGGAASATERAPAG